VIEIFFFILYYYYYYFIERNRERERESTESTENYKFYGSPVNLRVASGMEEQ
jgi:hypothetical protein